MSNEILERRYYVDGPFGQIHIREARPRNPTNKPPLVCFHQSPVSGAQYLLFQRVVAQTRRVLCPDTPGFGRSDAPPFVPSIAHYADAMATGLRALGFGENAQIDVLGFHTGTSVAVELSVAEPRMVRRVVLSSLALFSADELAKNRAGFGGPRPLFDDPQYVARYYRDQVERGLPGISQQRRFDLFVERLSSGPLSWYGPEAVFTYPAAERLKQLGQQTLLLVLKDTLSDNTRRAASLISQSQIVERMDIHGPAGWDSHPHEIAKELLYFLDHQG